MKNISESRFVASYKLQRKLLIDIKQLKTVARRLTLIKKRILTKMPDKENIISIRIFAGSFYHRLLDGIRWNSLALLIMYRITIITEYLAIAFKHFTIRDDYGENTGLNTWRLRSGLKNYRDELLDDAVSKITCILYYSMWNRIWIIKRHDHKRFRKECVYGLVYVAQSAL
jgi:hypothetical protein